MNYNSANFDGIAFSQSAREQARKNLDLIDACDIEGLILMYNSGYHADLLDSPEMLLLLADKYQIPGSFTDFSDMIMEYDKLYKFHPDYKVCKIKTYIDEAAEKGNLSLVKAGLYDSPVDEDWYNRLLNTGARRGHSEIVKFMIECGANDKIRAREIAITNGHHHISPLLQ